ncbi:LysR family transcriptional regulator [Staphylococcus saprophyticus]|jgi:DNA-binding transcriptional LysR family regulator|uniref:Transcriptional regulator n=1 Tax=Staphylococcus saprophyticus subsp. saprophyticus (strain ATCC 15305 / DSM 20229 / NCIMB 8711 / NCTC 7292 / S-41) TaxID=342451 RepID=Q49V80_STAS1|nr:MULTISPECIES: LysR family transcriptional regulator [Staphylococcus]CRV25788.1 LysR family transcriptional regulator [Streptococcus equi subsp. equi]AMG18905.1 LysR family transcriptional regulator [Staphylococcus saprophyticus]AMG34292.1 LysR family transcriptional regulator [Staphylococcus saprophyticus]ASE57917.1 LysR family transcriptional regulator [Staphylococcus saprophyticus]ASF18953.1 LysR family transcriptional regulator [Staphylococcus saprophyticus]
MEIKQMKYFVEVVKNGGMTRASKHLYIAQSTISKNIKSIEDEFNVTLFDRRKKHIILTDIGQIFYDKCVEALAILDDLSLEMDDVTNIERGHIRLGVSAIMDVRLFTESLNQFHSMYPNVTYEVVEGGGKAVEFYLNNDEIDVGITTLPVDDDIYHAVPLYKEKLMLVVDKNSKYAKQSAVYLGDLKNERFIMFHDDYYIKDQIIESCRKVGFHPKVVAKMAQITFIENMILDGIGVSILPESIVSILNKDITGIEITGADVNWNLGIIWKKESYINYVTREWINFLKSYR